MKRFSLLLALLTFSLMRIASGQASDLPAAEATDENPMGLPVLSHLEKPFLFTYGAWAGKAKIEGGVAGLHDLLTNGGAGVNEIMVAKPEHRPILRILVGPENTAKRLRLVLRDADGNTAVWEYDLEAAPKSIVSFLRPIGNRPLSQPHTIDKNEDAPGNVPDAAKLTQWKLTGDWTDKKLDVDVSLILLGPE